MNPTQPPDDTEWELEIIAEFYLAASRMEDAVWARIDANRAQTLDRVSRYSVLRVYLNNSRIQHLRSQGKISESQALWKSQRQKYSTLLTEFAQEARACQARSEENRDEMNSWAKHQQGVRSLIRIRYTVAELWVAFALHGLGLPASAYFVRRACARIRCCFPPCEIVPIRSTC